MIERDERRDRPADEESSLARSIGTGLYLLDLNYLGTRRYIATAALVHGGRVALVDPGPTSALPDLRRGLSELDLALGDVEAILLTHIHLDHAGATGTIVRENPEIRVMVHRLGARHLVDPSRLLASAERLYGDEMDRLWGEVAPVDEERVEALSGGERLEISGRSLRVADTPGHARHHVSYFVPDQRMAFVGDTCGIRIDGAPFVLPVTPPPDIDLEAWEASLDRIVRWHPDRLFVTHFGPAGDAADHLDEHRRRLRDWAERVRRALEEGGSEEEAARRFADFVDGELERHLSPEVAELYRRGGEPRMSWTGLARYWRKHHGLGGS